MSKISKSRASDATHDIQRIRVNAQGYDSDGAYWGAGPDVFIATSPDGSDQITVRAKTLTDARTKIAAEQARPPAAPAIHDDPLGGNPPRKTRYEIQWLNPVSNEPVTIRITHARDYLSSGSDHIEVESIKPKKAPLPITETGYRSHFMPPLDLINAGGPVTFVNAWLAEEAKGKAWSNAAKAQAQGDLFSWADANDEVATSKTRKERKPTTEPKPSVSLPGRPDGKPSRRRQSRRRSPT